ncbi:MAG: efflux RND transporter periplasmic adaptor subunit [Chromatiales bacterium]|nr:efflux RND transporter periplasmic adaptor subunit [Chromatiales bacterium]
MSARVFRRALFWLIVLAVAAALAWGIHARLNEPAPTAKGKGADKKPVPVETAAIEHGPIEDVRSFTGTLGASAEFDVAPKVGGRVRQLNVDLADPVERGQVVAWLDDAEFVQAVAVARADLEVARASHAEAESLVAIAKRELERIDQLRTRGVSSESQRDTANADYLAKQAQVSVTRARIASAEAQLEAARIRLGYTKVAADWREDGGRRFVAERVVDEGDTVAANAPLLRIVALDPVEAVFYVTERDYTLLRVGQTAALSTDAHPGGTFAGVITRIAPVFREASRQARVELRVDNPELKLKPGMFIRAAVVLATVEDAVIVPEAALVKRDDQHGVFVLTPDGASVVWRPVRVGIQSGLRVQVHGEGLDGRVVVLGQQLLKDGSAVRTGDGKSPADDKPRKERKKAP